MTHEKVSVYINEADQWQKRPLHLELLSMLSKQGIAGGTVLRAIAGFTQEEGMVQRTLFRAGKKMPLVVEFIDDVKRIEHILPELKKMASHRLILREPVEIVN
jgi:PII-like signaling protein